MCRPSLWFWGVSELFCYFVWRFLGGKGFGVAMFEQLGYEGVEGTRRGVDDVGVDYMYLVN